MLFQRFIPGEENPNEIIFHVPIGSAKTYLFDFHPYTPVIKYLQHDNNTCLFSILVSTLIGAIEHILEQAIMSLDLNHIKKCIIGLFE